MLLKLAILLCFCVFVYFGVLLFTAKKVRKILNKCRTDTHNTVSNKAKKWSNPSHDSPNSGAVPV